MIDRSSNHSSDERGSRLLVAALLFTFLIHAVAMVAMVLFLLPGLPGGGVDDPLERARYVAQNPWLWRLGWLPWQLTALSDQILGIALLRTTWIPRLPAFITLLLTIAAIIPDQLGQARWITEGIAVAQRGLATGDFTSYLRLEPELFALTSAWAATLYAVGALGWTWCFVAARTWSPLLSWLSVVTWGIFLVVSASLFLPEVSRLPATIVSAGNAVGFVLMEIWFVLVAERVLRRYQIDQAHGRYAPWRHPRNGAWGRLVTNVCDGRFPRALCRRFPVIPMASDIVDVVYINYLVPAERLEPLLPPRLELQRLGPDGAHALFTVLTYRHGGFGPRAFGRFRRIFPSPIQSNWRIQVRDAATGVEGVSFITTAIDNTLYAIGMRTLAEGMPMHLVRADLQRNEKGELSLRLDPGEGSGPDLEAQLAPTTEPTLRSPWSDCFASWEDFLAYSVPQDRMLVAYPWQSHYTRLEIDFEIPLESCEPLDGVVRSRAISAIVGDAEPLCFRVPKVGFAFAEEVRVES